MLIRDILNSKSDVLLTVLPTADIRESAALMIDHSVSALMVLAEDGSLAGILTERDIARYFADGCANGSAPVSDAMTSELVTCSPEHKLGEIAKIMSDCNIRHLPVIVDGGVIGVVSIRDIVRFHLADLETENSTLRELISVPE
jgi:CBS domain-containing protein